MIISKPTIESFLEEAQDPIYHQIISKEKDYSMTVEFHVTGFNKQDKPISYCYKFPWCIVLDEKSKSDFINQAVILQKAFLMMAIDRECLPGIVMGKNMVVKLPKVS